METSCNHASMGSVVSRNKVVNVRVLVSYFVYRVNLIKSLYFNTYKTTGYGPTRFLSIVVD